VDEEFSIPRPRLSGGVAAAVCATLEWAQTNMRIVKANQNRKGFIEDVKAFFMCGKSLVTAEGRVNDSGLFRIPDLNCS
jgi:hypothetical protein